ncbi:MAG: hypothetical protein J0H75_12680, partial [Rhizobiales bacterium]|nr:hypothetical protein [Hyphomicrobiales bacterium]
ERRTDWRSARRQGGRTASGEGAFRLGQEGLDNTKAPFCYALDSSEEGCGNPQASRRGAHQDGDQTISEEDGEADEEALTSCSSRPLACFVAIAPRNDEKIGHQP